MKLGACLRPLHIVLCLWQHQPINGFLELSFLLLVVAELDHGVSLHVLVVEHPAPALMELDIHRPLPMGSALHRSVHARTGPHVLWSCPRTRSPTSSFCKAVFSWSPFDPCDPNLDPGLQHLLGLWLASQVWGPSSS